MLKYIIKETPVTRITQKVTIDTWASPHKGVGVALWVIFYLFANISLKVLQNQTLFIYRSNSIGKDRGW